MVFTELLFGIATLQVSKYTLALGFSPFSSLHPEYCVKPSHEYPMRSLITHTSPYTHMEFVGLYRSWNCYREINT
jgi:hypothetical protein